jgi:hypothetical protein
MGQSFLAVFGDAIEMRKGVALPVLGHSATIALKFVIAHNTKINLLL